MDMPAVRPAAVAGIYALLSPWRGHISRVALAINGALQAAHAHGLLLRLLDLRNSGDTAGDRRRVVGYAAIAFEATAP